MLLWFRCCFCCVPVIRRLGKGEGRRMECLKDNTLTLWVTTQNKEPPGSRQEACILVLNGVVRMTNDFGWRKELEKRKATTQTNKQTPKNWKNRVKANNREATWIPATADRKDEQYLHYGSSKGSGIGGGWCTFQEVWKLFIKHFDLKPGQDPRFPFCRSASGKVCRLPSKSQRGPSTWNRSHSSSCVCPISAWKFGYQCKAVYWLGNLDL